MGYKLKSINWYQSEEGRVTVGYLANQQLFNISLEGTGGGPFGSDEDDERPGYYELSLRNLPGRIFADYDSNPCFSTIEDAVIEAASILRQTVDFLAAPFRYQYFEFGFFVYLGEIKIARLTVQNASISAAGKVVPKCEINLLNVFLVQFPDYDEVFFYSLEEAKEELERLRSVILARFAETT